MDGFVAILNTEENNYDLWQTIESELKAFRVPSSERDIDRLYSALWRPSELPLSIPDEKTIVGMEPVVLAILLLGNVKVLTAQAKISVGEINAGLEELEKTPNFQKLPADTIQRVGELRTTLSNLKGVLTSEVAEQHEIIPPEFLRGWLSDTALQVRQLVEMASGPVRKGALKAEIETLFKQQKEFVGIYQRWAVEAAEKARVAGSSVSGQVFNAMTVFGAQMRAMANQMPNGVKLGLMTGAALAASAAALYYSRSDKEEPLPPRENPPRKKRCESDTKMISIPGGSFQMGSPNSPYEDERPVHKVTLSSFSIDQHDVTFEQYTSCSKMREDMPEKYKQSKWPMTHVTWQQAADYCASVGKRLPTEAEWEYVATGKKHDFAFPTLDGSQPSTSQARWNTNSPIEVGFYKGNYVVWGGEEVWDMAGNVWKWMNDWYENYNANAVTDPKGPQDGSYRVVRGGSWYGNDPGFLRAATRLNLLPGDAGSRFGFRCAAAAALVVPPQDSPEEK